MRSPFRIRIYDKAFAPQFALGDAESVQATPRHLAKSTASIVLPIGHHRLEAMLTPGHRAVIDYLTRPDNPSAPDAWLRVVNGPIWGLQSEGPTAEARFTFAVEDDWRYLSEALAWPVPGAALTAQTSEYDTRGPAPAETVIKGYLAAAATRLGLPVTVAPDLGRGATVTGKLRWDTLEDGLVPLARLGGLGMRFTQSGSGVVFDCYAPGDRTARVLSEATGTIVDWAVTRTGPVATRTIVGDGGQGTARQYLAVTDVALETEWGRRAEVFTDGREATSPADPTLAQQGQATLDAGRPTAGISVEMAETDVVRYGRTHHVGDLVAVQIAPGLTITDTLTEATVSWTAGEGLTVAPKVGDGDAGRPDVALVRAVSRLAAGLRKQRRR